MKFASVFTAALTFGVTLASPMLETRQDANTLAKKIVTIGTKIATLNNTVVTLRQGDFLTLAKALIIQQQSQNVLSALNDATASAKKTPKLSSDDSYTVAGPILDLLVPVQTLLNNLVSKKPVFATAVFGFGDLSKTVLKQLQDQSGATKSLSAAIIAILSDDLVGLAPSITDQLTSYFNDAIAAYSKCSGKVCLPPFPSITVPKPLKKSS